jgi:2-polyprenyl-3-methyl-5-hydroxy-6-metoxy-1,4-benzoquinol methylase
MPTIDDIIRLDRAPEPFQPGDAPFWDDPHISEGLLRAHLDDAMEAASRPAAEIDGAIAWLGGLGLLRPGARVLDLGCGPGLYAERMARAGCAVTGMDISPRSIAFARDRAERENLPITYRMQDFLQMEDVEAFDVALQVYGELSTFDDATRDDLLRRIHRAMAPGGAFVFDVSTPLHRRRAGTRRERVLAAASVCRAAGRVQLPGGCLVRPVPRGG